MLTLYGFGPAFGLVDMSPFVVKVAAWCRLAGVTYALKQGDPRKAPKGKLPHIDDDGALVADSTAIIAHLSEKHRDLDAGLSARDRAVATAVKAMVEEHLYFTSMYLRWQDERGWAVFAPTFRESLRRGGVPGFATGLVANMVRKQVGKTLRAQGTGRHSLAEIEAIAITHLDALSELLGDQEYFLGDAPRSIDATVWAFLYMIHDGPFETGVKAHLKGRANLVAYVERVREGFWKGPAT
jgi:glutathione S-transferase